jgi:hypothetical protein
MFKRKLSLMSFAIAAIAFAFTMDAHAAQLAVSTVLNHGYLVGAIAEHGAGLGALGMAGMAVGSIKPTEVKLAATKLFRIAVEGATSDGRTISRDWISQMAANYDPNVYGARVNLEHYRGIMPDGPFKAYGDVLSLEAREETEGALKGKLGLYASIEPTAELVAMTKAKQKIYTSAEVDPSFSDTKQAYLVGLAVTDSPASLGTSILSFAAQKPEESPFTGRKLSPQNLFTAGAETVIEFAPEADPETSGPSLLSRVKEMLGFAAKKAASDESRFSDVTQAVEEIATHGASQAEALTASTARVTELETQVTKLTADAERDRQALAELKTQLSNTGNGQPSRPLAQGGGSGTVTTDC